MAGTISEPIQGGLGVEDEALDEFEEMQEICDVWDDEEDEDDDEIDVTPYLATT